MSRMLVQCTPNPSGLAVVDISIGEGVAEGASAPLGWDKSGTFEQFSQ